jgi:hypothetical protein
MFFYEIRTTRRHKMGDGSKRRSVVTEYMEALKPSYVGEKIAALLGKREVVRVTVDPINQAKYIAATRSD